MRLYRLAPAAALLALIACGDGDRPQAFRTTVAPKTVTTAPGGGAAGGGAAPAAAAESGQALQYAVPDGWTQIPPAQFRDPNFIIDGIEGSEVYVTELPGGGGLVANVNRWRGQLGLDALAPEEVTARTHLDFLGGHGVLVDFSGTYSGMAPIAGGGGEPKEGWRLVGAAVELPDALVTVKMTGPADALDAQLQPFVTFVQSLRREAAPVPSAAAATPPPGAVDAGALPEGHPPVGQQPVAAAMPEGHPPVDSLPARDVLTAGAADVNLDWQLPEGWEEAPSTSMRVATLRPSGGRAELSLMLLGGAAGGIDDNIRNWYRQMRLDPPDAATIAGLETVEVLGEVSPLVEIYGNYSGMGYPDLDDAGLLGAFGRLPGQLLFIKMVGPRAEIEAERENFIRFCLSLTQR